MCLSLYLLPTLVLVKRQSGYDTLTDQALTVSATDVSTGTKTVTVTMVATGDQS